MAFTISKSGKLDEVRSYLDQLEGPPTDSPDYPGHCHAKQHALDFISRANPSAELSISISGDTRDGKRHVSVSMVEG